MSGARCLATTGIVLALLSISTGASAGQGVRLVVATVVRGGGAQVVSVGVSEPGVDASARWWVGTPRFPGVVASPDGSHLAFSTSDGLAVAPSGGGAWRIVARGTIMVGAWSPDARWILFYRDGEASGAYLVSADGTRRGRVINQHVHLGEAVWAPDSRHIVAADGPGIFELDLGGRVTRAFPDTELGADVAFSPDGRWVAFNRIVVATNHVQVVIARSDFTHRRLATRNTKIVEAPTWSPDNNAVAYSQSGRITVVNRQGRLLLRMHTNSTTARPDLWPQWSPDGRSIVFARQVGVATGSLRVGNPRTGNVRNLGQLVYGPIRDAWTR